ncbi:hypothetical protein FA95DRAFT_1681999 [Auriscalpium vulgare]|uniref:Uncharacterized protein n=1 Tax=Auriscalpium vulgare TaxID=40419 RepID=A0ACB8RHC1_9AGAM|nr:hypothetical protein FA95DRAFT_1681999 [Auriscalpium vulgare]
MINDFDYCARRGNVSMHRAASRAATCQFRVLPDSFPWPLNLQTTPAQSSSLFSGIIFSTYGLANMEDEVEQNPGESAVSFWSSTLLSRLSFLPGCSPKTALARLKSERTAVVSLLATLDAHINAVAPVSRLPPELLCRVFSNLVEEEEEEGYLQPGMDRFPRTMPWVRLSHVCRHWRDVALNDPTFWARLNLPLPPQWADAIISRSQGSPLFLSCRYNSYAVTMPVTWLPIDSLENVQHMELLPGHNCSGIDLARVLSSPAPLLEDVSIVAAPLPVVTLSTPFFADHAPRLRKLAICNVRGSLWTSSFLRNLVCFHVSGCVQPPRSMREFMIALQQLNRLEVLGLHNCFPSFSTSRPSDTSQTAQLPLLRQLKIAGTASECVGFLHHVQTPSTATLSIQYFVAGDLSEFTALCSFLAPSRGAFRCVRLLYETSKLAIKAYHDTFCDPPDRRLFMTHRLGLCDEILLFMRALFRDGGMLRHCFELDLEVLVSMTPTMWLDTFGVAAEVQQMNVVSRGGIGFCLALSATAEGDMWRMGNGTGTGAVVWPKLQRLQLSDVDFQHHFVDDEEFGVGPENTGMSVGEVLLRALEHRQRCGARLVELELEDCDETEQWVREAEGFVGRVSAVKLWSDDHSNDVDEDDKEQESSGNDSVDGSNVEVSSEDEDD